ncbi:MAG TPA: hypothetical protein VGN14_19125 [Candidatus Elarobacter sp.]
MTTLRFALAILCNALALIVWDVGTRPPQRLAADIVRSLRSPRTLALGTVRFIAGLTLLCAAIVIAAPSIPTARAFSILETGMLIVALLVEQLVGEDARKIVRRRQTSR